MTHPRFASFQYRDYRLFWLGGAFSNVGMWALISGRLWLMAEATDSAVWLGLVSFSSLGPVLVLSVWGGVIADRVNRRRLVICTRSMFSLIALLTGVLIITEVLRPWHIIATSLATGVLLSFDIPSRQAMLPNLVKREDIVNAIAMYAILPSGAAIIGPAFFAPIVNLWGLEGLFFTIGTAYALTVAMLAMMEPLAQRRAQERATIWRGLLQGFSYIRGNRGIVTLIALGVVAGMFGMSFQTLLPIFADRILLGGVESYSYLLLSEGIGGLIGTLTLVWLVTRRNSPRILLLAGIGFGLGLAAFSQIVWLPASVVAMGLVGGVSVMFVTANSSIVQGLVAEEFRGRVMSIHQLTWGTTAIGGLLLGLLAQSVSAPFALTLGGLVTAGATFVMGSGLLRLLSEPSPAD